MTKIDIKQKFLNFFKANGHTEVLSHSLVPPNDDKSLMFVNSGMVQFKDSFLGLTCPSFSNVVTSQMCLRAGGKHNDIENVGYTTRHHTFFEMLGNFSFGITDDELNGAGFGCGVGAKGENRSYFKKRAIKLAWEFLTSPTQLGINEKKLLITVYYNDDEAFNLWVEAGVDPSKITRVKTNDNFWSMGDTGPCGPCSEIYYDYGTDYSGKIDENGVDGERYLEIWNLVFMQYEKLLDGTMRPLARQCIDTGMGLERITSVIEGKTDNYETSIFVPIINQIAKVYGVKQDEMLKFKTNLRILADHMRAICFMIAGTAETSAPSPDSISPSNEGRGYVLRRIMRRAMRYANQLTPERKMYQLVDIVLSQRDEKFLHEHSLLIKNIIRTEEESFGAILERGLEMLNEELCEVKIGARAPEEIAFQLYDTFGFPVDLSMDFFRQNGILINSSNIEELLDNQRARSRKDRESKSIGSSIKIVEEFLGGMPNFDGKQNVKIGYHLVLAQNSKNSKIAYACGGGQPGDTGSIVENLIECEKSPQKLYLNTFKGLQASCNNALATVVDTFLVHHKGQAFKVFELDSDTKTFDVNGDFTFVPNLGRRYGLAMHHTATHLLHATLHKVIGKDAIQKGSQLYFDRLRFDFAAQNPLTEEEIEKIESIVNEQIILNLPVTKQEEVNIDDAKKMGAMSLFGEKYGDMVNVVTIENASIEFCGGTHVNATGELMCFKILNERGIGAGIRRIEATVGLGAINYLQKESKIVKGVMAELSANRSDDLVKRVKHLKDNSKMLQEMVSNTLISLFNSAFDNARKVNFCGINALFVDVKTPSLEDFATVTSKIISILNKKNISTVVAILAEQESNGCYSFLLLRCKATQDNFDTLKKVLLTNESHSGSVVHERLSSCEVAKVKNKLLNIN